MIFDVCNVFNFFKLNPDGREDKTDGVLSLNQKIFMEKVALFKAMQSRYAMLTPEDKDMYVAIRDGFVDEISSLNRNYIGVQNNLKYVEKYSDIANWENFNQQKFTEVKKYIAPNITGESDIESARMFDYLAYRFSATKLVQNNNFAKTAKAIYEIARYYFIRKNMEINHSAIQKFLDNQKAKGRNDAQLTYIKELIVYINKNGKFERKDLLKEELHFAGLFDNLQIVSLLTDLESLL